MREWIWCTCGGINWVQWSMIARKHLADAWVMDKVGPTVAGNLVGRDATGLVEPRAHTDNLICTVHHSMRT
jgi:hypothetical protein